jgi:hypothetical protein
MTAIGAKWTWANGGSDSKRIFRFLKLRNGGPMEVCQLSAQAPFPEHFSIWELFQKVWKRAEAICLWDIFPA